MSPPVSLVTGAGDVALSYADFICPPACIEPALCPHTRGPRSWSLSTELGRADDSYVFPCVHLTFGVATIEVAALLRVRDRVVARRQQPGRNPRDPFWLSTASHCHGLAARVTLT